MNDFPIWLTGVSTPGSRVAANGSLYGRLGLLVQPGTWYLAEHIADYHTWALDNGCFSTGDSFDGDEFIARLDQIVNTVDSAWEKCLFAVAPDVFDPLAMRGDAKATIQRSRPFFARIRKCGVRAALVAQDGIERMIGSVPWDEFDAVFIGGSTAWKLGLPSDMKRGYPIHHCDDDGATDPNTRKWAEFIYACFEHQKYLHVGRVNSAARYRFCCRLFADSCDGTYLRFGPKNLRNVHKWLGVPAEDRQKVLF